jgi:pimeloyl-ACP methyl ester carboxylesterase
MMHFASYSLLALMFLAAPEPPRPEADPTTPPGIPFQRYTAKDSLGRTITFYLSVVAKNDADAKRPVALFIAGSGCQSLFKKRGEQITGGYQNLLFAESKGRVRVLVVEKPGVKFLDAPAAPGTAKGASEEFLKEHTLPRWAAANAAALRAAWTLPGIDPTQTLVLGHSEGGIVAARVAAELPQVTHVASLAAGGPTQLFDLAEVRSRAQPDDKPGDAERRVREVYEEWSRIQKDPDSMSKFWLGHPYRRWSSFLKHSVTEELLRTKAKVYLAQGTADATIPVKAHDVLVAELRARGRDVTAERIEGADHGFRTAETPEGSPAGMQALLGRLLEWFVGEPAKGK